MARSTRRDRPGPEREGGRVVVALVLGLGLLAGAAYAGAHVIASDKVPIGTTVGGVDIGGQRLAAAEQSLREGLAGRADSPFTVIVNGQSQQVPPSEVGLAVDYAASVRRAGADRSWRPSRLWRYFTDGAKVDPVVTLDQTRLGALVKRLDASAGTTPTDGSVVFRHQTFTVRPPRPGSVLDPKTAGTAFWDAYLTGSPSVQLRMMPTPPAIGSAAVARFVKRFANPAMASAVVLHFGPTDLRLTPAQYGDLLGARPDGNHLRPVVDAAALARLTDAQLAGSDINRPTPATVALLDGQPQVIPAKPGVGYSPHAVASALIRAIGSRDRTAQVRATPSHASFTSADARKLGITTQLSSFTTRLPLGRHQAAVAAAVARVDGTVLKPGDAFSLRGLLAGSTPKGAAGDAVATALFNAAWLSGLRVTAHAAGATYTRTAPLGRDASLRDGQDLAFTDNSHHGLLVSAVEGPATSRHRGSITVTLWSTPTWTVTSRTGRPTHVVAPGRHVVRGSACTSSDGRRGFRVTVTRSFARGGAVDHTSAYTVTYAPVAAVVCKPARHHRHH